MKLGLCIIARKPDALRYKSLFSIREFVDAVYVVYTEHGEGATPEDGVPADIMSSVMDDPERSPRGWVSDFSKARNQARLMAEEDGCDAWCWIDTDTILYGGEAWRAAVQDWYDKTDADTMQVRYDYAFNGNGECVRRTVTSMVCRAGRVEWKWPIHELPRSPRGSAGMHAEHAASEDFYLVHETQGRDEKGQAARNLWICQNHEEHGREMDAHMHFSKAKAHHMLHQDEEAVQAYNDVLTDPASPEQEYTAAIGAGQCSVRLGHVDDAQQFFLLAHTCFPERRAPFIHLAKIAYEKRDLRSALAWARISLHLHGDEGGSSYDPSFCLYTPVELLAGIAELNGDFHKAMEYVEQLPQSEAQQTRLRHLMAMAQEKESYQAYQVVTSGMTNEEAMQTWAAAPEHLAALPQVAAAKLAVNINDMPAYRTCVIYCGPQRAVWGPDSVQEGIGGSEEAVIYLSEELAKAGWNVLIFGLPPKRIIGDLHMHGDRWVAWMPTAAWSGTMPCDLFIAWRRPEYAELAPQARQRWVWCHDVIQPSWRWPEQVDKALVLSEYHTTQVPEDVPYVVTSNGLASDVSLVSGVNAWNKFIYASSPDRGLLTLLEAWPEIYENVPNAHLDIYYGYTTHWRQAELRNPRLAQIRRAIDAKLEKLEGVTWHGMVPHAQLHQAFADAGFWLYPTDWKETSCITAMKAQALGCIPITSKFVESALPETCQWDLGDENHAVWRANVLLAVQCARGLSERQWVGGGGKEYPMAAFRDQMKVWARAEFSWAKVAEQWTSMYDQDVPEEAAA